MNEKESWSGLQLTEKQEKELFNWAKRSKVKPKIEILNPIPIWSRFLGGLRIGGYYEVVSIPKGFMMNKGELVRSMQLQPFQHYLDEPVRNSKRDRFIIKIGSFEVQCFRGKWTHSVFVERQNFDNHKLTEFLSTLF